MRVPIWTTRVDEALTLAARRIHLLAACTPTNAQSERARLTEAADRGERVLPKWTYASPQPSDVRARLDRLMKALETFGDDPLAQIYSARARELGHEAALVEAVSSPAFAALAKVRFSADSSITAKTAATIAARWIKEPGSADERMFRTDGTDPESLLALMRKEVGRRALPFRVQVHASLSSLAATGDGIIYVAADRLISETAAARTVLHEIEGHALPRVAASKLELAIFRIGTARGTDDQEGLALLIEERAGFLVGARRRDLAARAVAVTAMRNGADFADIVELLKNERVMQPVIVAERIFRGSDGRLPGLGRESVYLEAFVRVKNHLDEFPDAERVLTSGQVSVDAAAALASHAVT